MTFFQKQTGKRLPSLYRKLPLTAVYFTTVDGCQLPNAHPSVLAIISSYFQQTKNISRHGINGLLCPVAVVSIETKGRETEILTKQLYVCRKGEWQQGSCSLFQVTTGVFKEGFLHSSIMSTPLSKPQMIVHIQKSLNYTVFDSKWIPCSAKFVCMGNFARGTGVMQIYEVQRGDALLIKEVNFNLDLFIYLFCRLHEFLLYFSEMDWFWFIDV